jgi:hypothetical protein
MMKLRDRLHISKHRQTQLVHGMQLTLFGLIFVGIERGSVNIILNALLGLAVTFLPAILERDLEIPMDPALTLWISAAAFMHAVGVIALPGAQSGFYSIEYYDHLTHALSATVVAATGYATVRAIDQHTEGIDLPPKFMFVFILVFVMAFGVFWELIEFGTDILSDTTGLGASGFTQHGLEDTMLDLMFNTMGGVVVAIWGTVYLADVAEAVQKRLESRESVE